MSGLIRGKRLVWVRDGMCDVVWVAESQFGTYTVEYTTDKTWCWSLTAMWDGDASLITNGESDSRDLAQAACQADHDQRAMASVEVVPFEWSDAIGKRSQVGELSLCAWKSSQWCWTVRLYTNLIASGADVDESAAITAAETFVRQLVMGVQS